DADMQDSATAAQPLVEAVLGDGVDMAIALLPPQEGAGGMGIVVRTARSGIQRATGWEPTQPLSGTRCITRETWDACQPLAPGWGVETSLTIDALTGGFWVKEIECDLHHRATGRDLSGQLHRARQLKDVLRALARRRHVTPDEPVDPEPTPEPTPESESTPAPAPDGFEEGITPHVGLAALAREIGGETELVWLQLRKGIRTTATLRRGGLIELEDGRRFADPSAAAEAASRRHEVEGWRVWRLTDEGPTLGEAIEELGQSS
ncbi:MAG: hypothetical protein Q4G64_08625, partial [bacterium]|nr:hypothetical protein [bacterium]